MLLTVIVATLNHA